MASRLDGEVALARDRGFVAEHRQANCDKLRLELVVHDQEVMTELLRFEAGEARERYALAALRLGVLALRQASGAIDSGEIRQAGERMITDLQALLNENGERLKRELGQALADYLDPRKGTFQQRIERLIADDGELVRLLKCHVDGEDSAIAKTLARQVGEASPLVRLLDPASEQGFSKQMTSVIHAALSDQRDAVLAQFSLDSSDSALSRLVQQITDKQGKLRQDFAQDIAAMTKQFSLDDENSALSRLVSRVDKAQEGIVRQFTLDDEQSALSRLRREITDRIGKLAAQQGEFQESVRATLASLNSRRVAEAKSPVHGVDFEESVSQFLRQEAERLGDLFDAVGARTGRVPGKKVGDQVIEMGPESHAAGRKIVFECKERQGYSDQEARDELDQARKNREAHVGVFVWSAKVVPPGVEPLRRFGRDAISVVWDADDPTTDVYLRSAYSVARALVFGSVVQSSMPEVPVEEIEQSILRVEKHAQKLEQISRSGQTIKNSAETILDEARKLQDGLNRELELLQKHMQATRTALAGKETGR
jgi:hypothetical protein